MAIPIVAGGNIDATDFTGTRYESYWGIIFQPRQGIDETFKEWTPLEGLKNNDGAFANHSWVTGVNLPHGATVTNLRMYYRQADNAAQMVLALRKSTDFVGGFSLQMALCVDQNIAVAYGFTDDAAIVSPIIDNLSYGYYLRLEIINNANIDDLRFMAGIITYTIDNPKP